MLEEMSMPSLILLKLIDYGNNRKQIEISRFFYCVLLLPTLGAGCTLSIPHVPITEGLDDIAFNKAKA